jgi:protein-tyrosine phosphatase
VTAAPILPRPPFAVLAVCTGNICRSPAVEVALRKALEPGADVVVLSAGLHARVGQPVEPAMARLLGDVPDGLRGRQVTPDLVRAAGLILTMTREHRRALVTSFPSAVRRTFTLREFAELGRAAAAAGSVDAAGSVGTALEALVRAAPRHRAQRAAGDDDIEDPYGRDDAVFTRVHAAIEEAVRALAGVLRDVTAHSQ